MLIRNVFSCFLKAGKFTASVEVEAIEAIMFQACSPEYENVRSSNFDWSHGLTKSLVLADRRPGCCTENQIPVLAQSPITQWQMHSKAHQTLYYYLRHGSCLPFSGYLHNSVDFPEDEQPIQWTSPDLRAARLLNICDEGPVIQIPLKQFQFLKPEYMFILSINQSIKSIYKAPLHKAQWRRTTIPW